MSDLSKEQFTTKIPDGDSVKAWWEAAPALPADTTLSEFMSKTLKACHVAQVAENANLEAGNKINGYPEPINGSVFLDAGTGIMAFRSTLSVTTLVPVTFDNSVSPSA